MNKDYLISKLTGFLEESKGDWGRNQYLLERIKQNKEILNSDKIYLETLLKLKISEIPDNIKKTSKFQELVKCASCDKEIKFNEKSLRDNNFWYHELCQKIIIKNNSKNTKLEIVQKIKQKKDPIQFILVGAIFVFLIASVAIILGPISMIAMGLGGALTVSKD